MLAVTINTIKTIHITLHKNSFILDSFCTAITEQTIDKITHTNIQPNRAFTVSSPSAGMGKSERVNIIKNINAHIKKAPNFSTILINFRTILFI